MTKLENILNSLKNDYNVSDLKIEFESESYTKEDLAILKNSGLNLTVKLGGCASVKDMYEAKDISATSIVAPMIETSYGLDKFVKTAKSVFEDKKIKLYINIETITGYENLDTILCSPYFENISGIILGRTDMSLSMNETREFAESDKMLEIAVCISKKLSLYNKEFIIGGNITQNSIDFLKHIPYLTKFETRKVIFDKSILHTNPKDAISEALDFEIELLKNKTCQNKEDIERIQLLEKERTERVCLI